MVLLRIDSTQSVSLLKKMPNNEYIGKPKPANATKAQMHHVSAHNMILNGGSAVNRNAPRQVKSMAGPAHYVANGSMSSGKK